LLGYPRGSQEASFVPIGANIPELQIRSKEAHGEKDRPKTVAVFGVTGGEHIAGEVRQIAHAVRHASNKNAPLRLDVLGRHSKEAEPLLRRALEGVEVAVTTQGVISTEQTAPPPNAIKCDVEGAEVEALRGAEKLLRTHHPWIVCEMHSETNEQDSRKFLRRLGYRIGSVESNHVLAVPEFVGTPMESS
jgi:FkbM family methyltransferase